MRDHALLIKILRDELEHEGVSGPIAARVGMSLADALHRRGYRLRDRIEWYDEPGTNARWYVHLGCDASDRPWLVPLDDCPSPRGRTYECARCDRVLSLVAAEMPSQ